MNCHFCGKKIDIREKTETAFTKGMMRDLHVQTDMGIMISVSASVCSQKQLCDSCLRLAFAEALDSVKQDCKL